MAVHIPAWKRLGLKLKYASEQPDRDSAAVSTKAHDLDLQAPERPAKRRRVAKYDSPESSGEPVTLQNTIGSSHTKVTDTSSSSTKTTDTSANGLHEASLQRKKSVTFSEETKQDDGDSRTTIDFPAGSPGSTPRKSANTSDESPLPEQSPTATVNDSTPTKKKAKVKGSKSSLQKGPSTRDKSGSALAYLSQHQSDREAWKFNKILDVWILNHALDLQAIPSTSVAALGGYVRGLPPKAGSRTRLIKECKEALAESQLEKDSTEHDRTTFLQLIDSRAGPLQNKGVLEEFLQSHSRPAILLWALDETVGQAANGFTAAPVVKKKSRTSAPIDVSSSSESDSESDSSTDSSDSEPAQKTSSRSNGLVSRRKPAATEDTSSSGSSSSEGEESTSSSDSSSDSEEDR